MRQLRNLRPLALLLLLAAACGMARAQFSGVTPTSSPGLNVRPKITTDPSILFPADREMTLMPGDVLQVTVYGVLPEYLDTERISLDGNVRLNLAGIIHLEGLSLTQAEKAIAARFEQEGMFRNAQVAILVSDAPAHIATIIGEVKGNVPVAGHKRLFDVLSAAGGLTPVSSNVISIDRPGLAQQIVVDLGNDPGHSAAANIPVFAGDTITVGRVGLFYVVGAVTKPGATPLQGSSPVTVMQAVAASGGATFAAKLNDTKLIRTVGNQRTAINVPLGDIMKGRASDPVLQSDDILLVPSSAINALLRSGGVASAVAVAASLAAVISR
jgi:polysaccharide export outer membrane protein